MPKKNQYSKLYTLRSDGRYQGYYRDKLGNRHTVCDKDPEKLYQKILEKQAAQQERATFSKVADEWQDIKWKELRENTQTQYSLRLKQVNKRFGDTPIEDIKPYDIQKFLESLYIEGHSAEIIYLCRIVMRSVFQYAIASGDYESIMYNPVDPTSVPKQARKNNKREAPEDKIIKAIQDNVNLPFGEFALFLLCTGFRRGEAIGIQWQDIDFKNSQITCSRQVIFPNGVPTISKPKSEAGTRTVPILEPLKPILKKPADAKPDWFVFSMPDNPTKPMANTYVYSNWKRYASAIGYPDLIPHQLRHGYATMLYEAGVDPYVAQRLLGHADLHTTQEIYTHLREKQKNTNIQKLLDYTQNGIK